LEKETGEYMNKDIKVLMASVEAAPLVKVGGLADVVGSLPPALNILGCDARLIIPKYSFIDEARCGLKRFGPEFSLRSDGKDYVIKLWRTDSAIPGTVVYLIENDEHFGGPEIYSSEFARHESEKFLFFDLAVLESLPRLDFFPDIIHCHDFHCGLLPALLKNERYRALSSIKTLFTIHNFEYQGRTAPEVVSVANIDIDSLPSLIRDAEDGDINFMVQGIINSDLVNTVSPSYAKEIVTEEFAAGLSKITKAHKLRLKASLTA
jgi:starch synthase